MVGSKPGCNRRGLRVDRKSQFAVVGAYLGVQFWSVWFVAETGERTRGGRFEH